ncbi:MAG: SpaH/EbpB family LPXTG-anchored major pilin [Blautia hansenii]
MKNKMKNKMKKMIAMFMMFAMILGLNTVAFAAEGTNTVHVNTGAYDVSNVTFKAYRVFDVTKNGDKYGYAMTTNFVNFFKKKSLTTDNDAYNYANDNQKIIADELKEYIATKSTTEDASAIKTPGKATFSSLADGYYIIVPSGATFSPNLVTVVGGEEKTVNLKGKDPTTEKKVEDKDWASAQVGKKVTFKVTSQVPDMTGKKNYVFRLKDTLSEGLTMNVNDFKSVKIGEAALTKDSDYTVKVEPGTKAETTDLVVEINGFEKYNGQAGSNIVFEYQAEVNKDAVTVKNATNEAHVEYGNDPNQMGSSQPDKVKVYTHTLTIKKVDGKDNQISLAGAEFELYEGSPAQGDAIKLVKESANNGNNEYYVADSTEQTTATTTVVSPANGTIVIKGLKAGKYTLKETKAPAGYNKGGDITITITADSSDQGENVIVTGNSIEVKNNSGIQLPSTGGMGTIIFVAAGVCVVGFLILTSRKTKRTK